MILGSPWWLTITGILASLGAGLGAGSLIASMLYGLKSYDPSTLIGASLLLIFVALAASWTPARPATRIDPMQVFCNE